MSSPRPSTARARLVAVLTKEILHNSNTDPFPIASEHQLCRRFQVSRVTVRLALGDLENRGLIYRKHGKGTFAHGRSQQVYRDIGVLMKLPQATEHRPVAEMIRGAQSVMAPLRSAVVLISLAPGEWRPERAGRLGGVIVMPQDITEQDLQVMQDRNVPFILAGQSPLPGPRINLGQRQAAQRQTELLLEHGHRRFAILSGYDPSLDFSKRQGIHDALKAAGIDPAGVPEFSAHGEENAIQQAARDLLNLQPRPTAVVALDDSLGSMLSVVARRQQGLRIPEDLSIVSFHDWPYLHYIEPTLTTVKFDFFIAGQRAAEILNLVSLTGAPVTDLSFEPSYRSGQTLGPAPAGA